MFIKSKNKRNLKKLLKTQSNDILIVSSKLDKMALNSFENCIIWPTYKFNKETFKSLVNSGHCIITEPFDEKFLNSKLLSNNHKQNFYYFDDLISGEVIKLFYKTNNENLHLYINCSYKASKKTVTSFDLDKLISKELINRIPVTEKLNDEYIDLNNGSIKPSKNINVFLIGYNEVNKELLKEHVINNQLVAKFENGYESLKVKYFIMNEKFNLYERDFISRYNDMKEKIIQGDIDEYFVLFEEVGKFFYYEGDPSSKDAMELIKYCIETDSYNYFYVSNEKPIKFVKTFKENFKDNKNCQLIVNTSKKLNYDDLLYYCNYKTAIKKELVAKENFEKVYGAYCQVATKYLPYLKTSIEDMDKETIEFIKSQFRNLIIKYAMLGLECVKKENSDISKVISISQYKSMIPKYKNALLVEEDKSFIEQYVKDVFSKNLSKELALSYHDHLKWCAFKIVNGYSPMKKKEVLCYKNITYKNDAKRENLFITQFYEIENVKEYLAYHSKLDETQFELSIYDALFTYISYDVLEKLGYVLQVK